jgi:hypothetical protein
MPMTASVGVGGYLIDSLEVKVQESDTCDIGMDLNYSMVVLSIVPSVYQNDYGHLFALNLKVQRMYGLL